MPSKTVMSWTGGHSRCFDSQQAPGPENILDLMRSLQRFDRLPKKPFPQNANCISMLVNGLIYRQGGLQCARQTLHCS